MNNGCGLALRAGLKKRIVYMNQTRLDLYTDDLIVTFGYATATGLSQLLDGQISHTAISRFLCEREYTSKDVWKQVKKTVREVEATDGILIFDDTVQETPPMDENDLIGWHDAPSVELSVL